MIIRSSEDIGGAIYEARRKLRLTQCELARRAGVSSRWLREVEHGKATAQIGLVLRIFRFLGLLLEISNQDSQPHDDYPDLAKALDEIYSC